MSLVNKLRRIALDRQGLLKTNQFGRGKQATLRAIEHLGYIQIDTISVVERAHHHVLWSRVNNYKPRFLEHICRCALRLPTEVSMVTSRPARISSGLT